jgi:hypothetical protein
MIIPFYAFLMARGLRPGRDGEFIPGQNNGVTQRVTKQGGNNEKMRNVTFILGYMDYMWLYGLYDVL